MIFDFYLFIIISLVGTSAEVVDLIHGDQGVDAHDVEYYKKHYAYGVKWFDSSHAVFSFILRQDIFGFFVMQK